MAFPALSNWLRARSRSSRRTNRGKASGRKRPATCRPERARLGLEQLEERRMPATIGPLSFTAGAQEVNNLTLTTDADWLTYNEAVPHMAVYAGAFNPEFLKGIKIVFTGDENNHLTKILINGDVTGSVDGPIEAGAE